MKILFLDIDGVITCSNSKWMFDIKCIDKIINIINKTNCKIVISSSWRGNTLEETKNRILGICKNKQLSLYKKLKKLTNHIIDVTDKLGPDRGSEIQRWINNNDNIENYVILDDDSDMLDSQVFHFVQSNYEYGISDSDMLNVIKILNNQQIFNKIGLNFTLRNEYINKCKGLKNKYDELIKYDNLEIK